MKFNLALAVVVLVTPLSACTRPCTAGVTFDTCPVTSGLSCTAPEGICESRLECPDDGGVCPNHLACARIQVGFEADYRGSVDNTCLRHCGGGWTVVGKADRGGNTSCQAGYVCSAALTCVLDETSDCLPGTLEVCHGPNCGPQRHCVTPVACSADADCNGALCEQTTHLCYASCANNLACAAGFVCNTATHLCARP